MKRSRSIGSFLSCAILALLSVAGESCSSVRPWERGRLLERCMQPSLDTLESAIEGHLHATREAMSGAAIAEGASCGCN